MAKRIDRLTPEQEAQMAPWARRWIGIGLQTGDADFETFERAIRVAYAKAGIAFPNKAVRVQSPIVGALAASISRALIQKYRPGQRSNAVHSAVGSAVDSAVGSAVGSAVHSAVHSAVDSAVRSVRLDWHDWDGGQFWVGWSWSWGSPSFVSFFTDIAGLELSPDIMERAKAYRDICASVNYFWPNTDFVMVCDRPQFIGRDAEGRLHSEQRKAIEYKDGWGLYALDGVVLRQELWERIVSGEMAFDEIVATENADERAVALKYNKNAIIETGAECIDSHPQFGELFRLTGHQVNTLLNERELYFMRMRCPTGRTFVECVEPTFAKANPRIIDCQAHAFGVSPEIYGRLQVKNEG